MEKLFLALASLIDKMGCGGIFVCTALEYACFPISSELLLPFIGYAANRGELGFISAIVFSTMGSCAGCSFCYGLGRFGGKALKKWSRSNQGLEKANRFFQTYGAPSVCIARVFPLIRTYISFPAGVAAFPFPAYLFYSVLGAFVWNLLLIGLGYFLGAHWQETGSIVKHPLFTLLVLSVLFFVLFKRRK